MYLPISKNLFGEGSLLFGFPQQLTALKIMINDIYSKNSHVSYMW